MCQEARRYSPSVTDCEADLLLQLDDVADRPILDATELDGIDAAGLPRLARLKKRRRTQQAADVIGTERRRRALGHGPSSLIANLTLMRGRSESQRYRTFAPRSCRVAINRIGDEGDDWG